MSVDINRWANQAPGAKCEDLYTREHFFCRSDHIITLHPFTITLVNCTPALAHVGGRPCVSLAGAGAATDGANFADAAASIRLVAGKQTRLRFSVRSADASAHEWVFGLYTSDTTIVADLSGGTPNSDYCVIFKEAADRVPRFRTRKGSGTEEAADLDLSCEDATWYDFDVEILPDAVTAGKGRVRVWARTALGAPALVLDQQVATQLPDTVSTCLCFGFLEGDTGTDATVVGVIGIQQQY